VESNSSSLLCLLIRLLAAWGSISIYIYVYMRRRVYIYIYIHGPGMPDSMRCQFSDSCPMRAKRCDAMSAGDLGRGDGM
jgi:hypothetical protein